MKFLKNSKGFTLAEMLIVMAVVVVLAAAAMPAVSNQIETARESIDLDTLRGAYSEAYTQAYMVYMNGTTLPTTGFPIEVSFEQKLDNWQMGSGTSPKIANVPLKPDNGAVTVKGDNAFNLVTFVFNENDTADGIKLTSATLSKKATS